MADETVTETVTETKSWWASKTIWGAVITVVCVVLSIFGVEITDAEQSAIRDNLTELVTLGGAVVGAVLSIYGRVKASKSIK